MYKYLKEQEKLINEKLDSNDDEDWDNLLKYFKTQIEFMQHERLIHLMVTLAFSLFLITSLIVTEITPQPMLGLLDLVLVIFMLFYIRHYYRLENGVERWYNIYNKIEEKRGKHEIHR